jgi:hypothetical protein
LDGELNGGRRRRGGKENPSSFDESKKNYSMGREQTTNNRNRVPSLSYIDWHAGPLL